MSSSVPLQLISGSLQPAAQTGAIPARCTGGGWVDTRRGEGSGEGVARNDMEGLELCQEIRRQSSEVKHDRIRYGGYRDHRGHHGPHDL